MKIMQRTILSCLGVLLLAGTSVPVLAAGNEGIAVIVNQGVITKSDVNDRMGLIATSTGMPQTPELLSKLRPQIVEMLIDEEIKLQEATRLKVTVSKEEIASGFAQVAAQNNIPPEQFSLMIKSRGLRIGTLENQIKSQIAWGKVVQKKIRPQIEVSDADVDSELGLLRDKIGKTEYLVSDIFLSISEENKEDEVRAAANRMVAQLRKQPEVFPRVAMQFSQAPGAAQGGSLGWISEGQLSAEIDNRLPALAVKEISDPIKTSTGYHILLVREKRQITESLLPSRDVLTQRIGNERLDRAQRRYMMDLRSSSYIESRV